MQQPPPQGSPLPPNANAAPIPAAPNLIDTVETAGGGLKAKWSSLELPIQIGVVVGTLFIFAAVARYIIPALLAAAGIGAVIAVLFVPYWLPTIIAFFRNHPNKAVIGLINFVFGWTFIGWFICLFWSLTNPNTGGQSVNVIVSNTATAGAPPPQQFQSQAPPAVNPGPQYAQPAVNPGQQYRVGDVVNGHRFDGNSWLPEAAPPGAPPPPPA